MDFLGGLGKWAGNIFNSIFGGNNDDEEKKRRQQQAAQQRAQQQQQKTQASVFNQPQPMPRKLGDELNKPLDLFKDKAAQPPKIQLPKRTAPVVPAVTDEQKRLKQQQISQLITYGKIKDEKAPVYVNDDETRRALVQRYKFSQPKEDPYSMKNIANGLADAFRSLTIDPIVNSVKEYGKTVEENRKFREEVKKQGGNLLPGAQSFPRFQSDKTKEAIKKAEQKLGKSADELTTTGIANTLNLAGNALGLDEIAGLVVNAVKKVTTRAGEVGTKEVAESAAEEFKKKFNREPTPDEEKAIVKEAEDQVTAPKNEPKPTQPEVPKPATPDVPAAPVSPVVTPAKEQVAESYKNIYNTIQSDERLSPQQKVDYLAEAKARHVDMLKKIDEGEQAQAATVATAEKQAADTAQAQQEAVATAQAQQEAATTPPPQDVVETPPVAPQPEQRINNAYSDYANKLVDQTGVNREANLVGDKKNILYDNPLSKAFFKTQQKGIEAVDKARAGVADAIQSGVQSGNKVNAAVSNAPKNFFKNFGLNDRNRGILIKRTSQIQNAGKVAKMVYRDMEKAVQAAGNPKEVYERIYRVLETPDFLERIYGNGAKLTVDDLTPAERVAFDKLVQANKVRNDLNFDTGLINAEQHAAFADGMHSPRVYDLQTGGIPDMSTSRYINRTAGKKRKKLEDINENVTAQTLESPFQASALRLEQALKNKANAETLNNLDEAGLLLDYAPNKNFVQLVGKKYGDAEGKFIDKQILSQFDNKEYFNSAIGQATGDLVRAYRESKLGSAERGLKSFKTVLSPATALGNTLSNLFAFSGAANVNAATAAARMAQAGKQLATHINGFDPNVYRAELAGLFSGDTGRVLSGSKEAASALKGSGKNPYKVAQDLYSGADKAFALGLFNEFKARGLSDAEAVLRAHKATQNYANAGRVVNTAADSPILGKPFARFTPELLRIIKNNLIYNPAGTAAKVGGLAAGGAALSSAAGETPEERQTRESAVGQTQLPGTGFINSLITGGQNTDNVSLNLPIGDSSVNISRLVGLNYPIEPGGDANSALFRQLNPFADITRTNAQGEEVVAPNQLVSSLLFRPIADQIANRDFMGREITDPNNRTLYEGSGQTVKKLSGQQPDNEIIGNRVRNLIMNYLPFSNETDALYNASNNQKDYYGKERTVPEAVARVFGLKVESNAPDVRKERVDTNQYFEQDLPAVQSFLRDNPDLASSYFKINNPSRNRNTNIKDSDVITPEKWDVINSDSSGRLFNFMKQQALTQYQRDGKPYDPIYALDPQRAKYVSELRSRPTGDDIEAEEILRATTDWYKNFEDAESKYYEASDNYYKAHPIGGAAAKSNQRVLDYRAAGKPVEQPAIVQRYYQIKAQDPDSAKAFYKNNKDELSAAFNTYADARLSRINAMRAIEGYQPISKEVYTNSTFGFSPDTGKKYGGGSGNSGDYNVLNAILQLGNSIDRLEPLDKKTSKEVSANFQKLFAPRRGGRATVTIGAKATGNPRS